jgi:hypothetical protein
MMSLFGHPHLGHQREFSKIEPGSSLLKILALSVACIKEGPSPHTCPHLSLACHPPQVMRKQGTNNCQ